MAATQEGRTAAMKAAERPNAAGPDRVSAADPVAAADPVTAADRVGGPVHVTAADRVAGPDDVTGPDDVAVATHGLVRDYGNGAGLHGIDLSVRRNEVYGLIGPNGAGKTTLLSILAGLRRADAGRVEINFSGRRVAMCPDAPEFEPWLTAREVVRQSRGLAEQTKARDSKQARRGGASLTLTVDREADDGSRSDDDPADGDPVAHVLNQVGLGDVAGKRAGGFSRGMKQRLSLAAALALEPELLILDEPSAALDPAGRAELFGLIAELAATRTVIFSSHILADVQRVAASVGVLDHGRLLFQGPTRTLIDSSLRPAWNIRVRGGAATLVGQLRGLPWVTQVVQLPDESIEVEATSAEAGEYELPRAIVAAGTGLVSVNPVDASLEAAFLALTSGQAGRRVLDAD
jgi:ABC-2 type transport system ATP-binding protein